MVDFDFGGHTFVNLVATGRIAHYFTTDKDGNYGGIAIQKFKMWGKKFNFKLR